jgi:hypothetical protein
MFVSRALGLTVVLAAALAIDLGAARVAMAATEKETELNARQAFAAARYDEAIELFARLYAETLNPIYLRNIGRCHQKKREPDKAIDAFQDYLAKGKSITSPERKEIQGYIKDMERLRDDQAKERQAAQATREKDKETAFIAAPPATPPPATPAPVIATTTTTVAPGGVPGSPAYGTPPPDPTAGGPVLVARPDSAGATGESHPVYKRWWFWTAIGVVVAGGVAAALLIPGPTTRPSCPLDPGACK